MSVVGTKRTSGDVGYYVVADRGYFKGEELLACEQAGVAVTLPKPQTSGRGLRTTLDACVAALELGIAGSPQSMSQYAWPVITQRSASEPSAAVMPSA
jgi:hypothetical protein